MLQTVLIKVHNQEPCKSYQRFHDFWNAGEITINFYPPEMSYAMKHLSPKECHFSFCSTCNKLRLFHLTRCLTCKPYKDITKEDYIKKYATK